MNNLNNLLRFVVNAEKLKTTIRHSYTSDITRKESSAEHSWMLALLAIEIFPYIKAQVDQLKVLKMVILHDLAEAVTGDIPTFEISDRQNSKEENEKAALIKLIAHLDHRSGEEIIALCKEFNSRETLEAKVAQALDKVEVLIQHNISDIKTWEQGDFDLNPYYRDSYFDFDPFFRELKDVVDIETMRKVKAGDFLDKVKNEAKERFTRRNN
jgi:putative hydrolases of HD superfamily